VREDKQWLPVFKGPISATGGYTLKSTTESLKDETQAYVTAVYKAVQWMKTASIEDIAKHLDRYADTMGLAPDSIRKALAWYKPVWTYDLVFTKQNYDNVNNVAKGIKAEKTYPYEEIVDLSFLKKASGSA
jgi:NitT/TauT family transport system substrate-binding protein